MRELHASMLRAALPPRPRDANKGAHGHVLIVGGDRGMGGAVLLAGRAALRAGAGLVSIATHPLHAAALTAAQPELMVHGLESADELDALMARADVVAVGPGLGQQSWGSALFEVVLSSAGERPMVVDADALNLLARKPRALRTAVLTPHPGEAARLLGCSTSTVQADRPAAVAALYALGADAAVLKGQHSLVMGHDAVVWSCPYGNPGMAVAGMGDALTGVIAGLLGQGLSGLDAARFGVLVHALAGDAAAGPGERGLLPSDLIAALRGIVNPVDIGTRDR